MPKQMKPLVDIHTYSLAPNSSDIRIYNAHFSENFTNTSHFSVGVHPWNVKKEDEKKLISYLENVPKLPWAIGEIGLDKTKDDYELQITLLNKQLAIAKEWKIPRIIIHCVKAYSDIIPVLKKYQRDFIFIWHDFYANKEIYQQCLSLQSYFSLGLRAFNGKTKISFYLDHIDKSRIFLETDENTIELMDLYTLAAHNLSLDRNELIHQIYQNYSCVTDGVNK